MMGHFGGRGLFEQLPQTLLLVLSAALLLLELVLLIALLARREGPGRRFRQVATWLGVGAPFVTATLMIWVAHLGRAGMMEAIRGIDPSSRATLLVSCPGLCMSSAGLELGGLALAGLGPVGGVLVALVWRRSSEGAARRLGSVAGLGLGLVVGLTGAGLAARYLSMVDGITVVAGVDPTRKLAMLGPVLEGGDKVLQVMLGCAGATLVLTCLALLVLVLRAGADELRAGPGLLVASVLVLALGAAAFGLTRSHARDLAGPLPTRRSAVSAWALASPLASHHDVKLPRLQHSQPLTAHALAVTMTHPEVDPMGGVVTLEGSEVATVRELLTATPPGQTITRLVELLGDQRRRWKMINPDRPYPAEVMLLAHQQTPAAAVEVVLASVLAAKHNRVQLVSGVPTHLDSVVLGRLTNTLYSSIPFRLVDRVEGQALTLRRGETLQALATRIDAAFREGRDVTVRVPSPAGSPRSEP